MPQKHYYSSLLEEDEFTITTLLFLNIFYLQAFVIEVSFAQATAWPFDGSYFNERIIINLQIERNIKNHFANFIQLSQIYLHIIRPG